MKEPYSKRIAIHLEPELCVGPSKMAEANHTYVCEIHPAGWSHRCHNPFSARVGNDRQGH